MRKSQRKRIIVVLGMHRSGTSAIARALQVLGVDLGKRLMPAAAGNNEKGFFEDIDANALTSQLLRALGREWDTLTPLDRSELERHDLDPFRVGAIELLRGKLEGKKIYGLKDPRLCLMLPFWKPAFSSAHADADYLISTRHPLSVAQSLKMRDGIELEKSLYLWLNHVASAISETRGRTRVVTSYDLLMRDPKEQLRRIARGFGLTFNAASVDFKEFKNGFLSEELRHSVFEPRDLKVAPDVPAEVVEAHELLEKLARDEAAIDSQHVQKFFEGVTARLDQMRPALAYMSRRDSEFFQLKHNEQIHALQLAISNRDGVIHGLNIAAGERESKVASLTQSIAEREAQVQDYARTVGELNDQIHALQLAISNRDGVIHGLNVAAGERESKVASLTQSIAEREAQVQDYARTVGELNNRIHALQLAISNRDGVIHGLNLSVGERDAKIANLAQTLAVRDSQAHSLGRTMGELNAQINALQLAISDRDGQINGLNLAAAELALSLHESGREVEINRLRLIDSLREASRRRAENAELHAREHARARDHASAMAQRDFELRHRDRLLGQFGHQFVSRLGSMLDPYPGVRWVITAPLRLIHWLLGHARA